MIYLSRLILDPRSRQARRDLADCHQLHRTILAAFPRVPDGVTDARHHFGVLYRVESEARGSVSDRPESGGIAVLVQANHQPDWKHLLPGYLLDVRTEMANPVSKQVDALYDAIAPGM